MSNSNDYVPFATASGANVETPSNWLGDSVRQLGFQQGTAKSIQANTAIRQASVIAAMIGQFCADYGPGNVVDNGNIPALEAQFAAALLAIVAGSNVPTLVVGAEGISNNVLTPPNPTLGNVGEWFMGQSSNNLWGPKNTSDAPWGTVPFNFGNNRLINVAADMTLIVVNCLVYWDATSTFTLTLPSPGITAGNDEITLCNNGTANQTVQCPTGSHITSGNGQWPSNESSITLVPGQYVVLKSLGESLWVAVANTGT